MKIELDVIYYESHITIEPVFGKNLEQLKEIVEKHNFKVANLLIQKDREITPERSDKDTFCTAKSKNITELESNMNDLLLELTLNSFHVWRFKIEAIIVDEKLNRNRTK